MQAGADIDAPLIEASRRGDRAAFAQIIERYQRAVYAVSFSGVRDRALADDLTQDTFVIAWRRLGELRDSRRLPAWLCGIARNLVRDARRRHRRETIGDAGHEPAHATTPYDELSEAESELIVATALGQVPDVYREPLVLYYYEERSVDEVARSLGISAATTNKRLSRGRRYLAECVAIVERGLVRHGPRPGLAASVLAVVAVTAPASHVDASPAHVKGSTMHKLALAAIVTASLGGAGVLVFTATRSDARAQSPTKSTQAATRGEDNPVACALRAASRTLASGHSHTSAQPAPSLTGMMGAAGGSSSSSSDHASNDCAAVGRHLAELEADTTHGPSDRPDEATCDECAAFYKATCEKQNWSNERKSCTLAAADLINAHLCATGATTAAAEKPSSVPATLTCATLAPHIATTAQRAGMHADVPDLAQQIEAACDMGAWSIELRRCFAAATSVADLETCFGPH